MTQFKVDHKPREARVETLEGYSTSEAARMMFGICFCIAAFMLLLWPGSDAMFRNGGWWLLYLVVAEVLCWTFAIYGMSEIDRKKSRMVEYQVSDKLELLAVIMPFLLPVSPCLIVVGIFFGAVILGILSE